MSNRGSPSCYKLSNLIDWVPIRHELDEIYDNKSEKGGRPKCDVILMFKILILQQWHGLSDLEVERQMADRISFMAFLGFPNPFPDSRTIWLFKERMATTEKDKVVWAELQRHWILWVYESSVERSRMLHSLNTSSLPSAA